TVAMRRVVETFGAADVADHRAPGVHTNPRDSELHAPSELLPPKRLAMTVPLSRAADGPRRVIGLGRRRAEENRDSVADETIDRAAEVERNLEQAVRVRLQQRHGLLRGELLAQRGEAFEIGKDEAHLALLPA